MTFSRRFTKDHEWIQKQDGDEHYSIGITDFAQNALGEVVYLSFPEVDETIEKKQELGEIESPKAVSVLYSPVTCTVVENNEALEDDFSVINAKADETSLFKVKVSNEEDLDDLLT